MREILFRGKRVDNGEWGEGYLIHDEFVNVGIPYIGYLFGGECHDTDLTEVIPETVCQYTGKTGKNAEKIWEHDIVLISGEDGFFEVQWDDDTARFIMVGYGLIVDFDNYSSKDIEVVGNIFDNPDLLTAQFTDSDKE